VPACSVRFCKQLVTVPELEEVDDPGQGQNNLDGEPLWIARLGLAFRWLRRQTKRLDDALAAMGGSNGLTILIGAAFAGGAALLFAVINGAEHFQLALLIGGLGLLAGAGGILVILPLGLKQARIGRPNGASEYLQLTYGDFRRIKK